MIKAKRWVGLVLLVPFLAACATVPVGPSVMVLPGDGKSFEQFQSDDAVCRQWAQYQTGTTPGDSAAKSAVTSAAVGTLLGAAAGAALGAAAGNPGIGAAAGTGAGLLFGSAVGANGAQYSAREAQHYYDMAYQQCMYAKGNQIPGVERTYRRSAPMPPPPPPPSSGPARSETFPPTPPPSSGPIRSDSFPPPPPPPPR
jgi:hypothetical protein